jgi:3-oxoacyl-[acyl-carrier-protein] synthase-3
MNVGIHGIGIHLPDAVRTNDWWPEATVAKWEHRAVMSKQRIHEAPGRPGEKLVLEAMRRYESDPFRGARERRVMPAEMESSDMELAAAKQAIANAGVDPKDIDFVLSYSFVPDFLLTPNAFALHARLGLSKKCFTTGVEAACNSFLIGLMMAEQMIKGGRAKLGLIVQSSAVSRILPPEEQTSAWFGDGAAAVVVGPVADGRGILGHATRTESSLHCGVVTGIPGKRWYDEGRSLFYANDRAAAFKIMVGVADNGKEIVDEALAEAGLRADQIDFFACHQVGPWMRSLLQDYIGLWNAKSIETFDWVGNLASVNVPLVLSLAEKDKLVKDGDAVVLHGGGAGVTYSGVVLRWGRG